MFGVVVVVLKYHMICMAVVMSVLLATFSFLTLSRFCFLTRSFRYKLSLTVSASTYHRVRMVLMTVRV